MTEKADLLHEIEITGYSHQGAGVGRLAREVIFVEGALAGERVLIRLRNRRKGYCEGELVEVLQNHAQRLTPRCRIFESCGGCQFQHVAYSAQLEIKEQLVTDALRRIGGLNLVEVHPVLGMDEPWAYRNKGHFRISRDNRSSQGNNKAGQGKGRIVLGFYEEGSHTLVQESCRHLFSPTVTRLLSDLEEILNAHSVQTAEDGQKGLHHLMIRESNHTGEIIMVFIGQGVKDPEIEKISREICSKFPQAVGVCHNSNPYINGPVLMGRTRLIWGRNQIEDVIGAYRFKISTESFFQVNTRQAQVLYGKALEYAALIGSETVIDAYCGIGTISLYLAEQAKKVIGIESAREAVADARKNALLNQIANVEFMQGTAEEVMPRLVKQGLRPDVVVVDPPRSGCAIPMLDAILQVKPMRVVYVSCNPSTLARDLKYLVKGGYEVKETQPVDMFPQTAHVECVVGMQRKDT